MSSTSVTRATGAGGRRASRRRLRGGLAWVAGTAAVAIALFTCYLLQSRTIPAGPDGASIDLLAWNMLHGNPLLHGWWVADVTFYTTELPQYMLLESARGLSPDLAHLGGAMTYTLLVLLAAFLARGRTRGAEGVARAVLGGGIMLAPQLGDGTQTLIQGPDHTGTAVPVLALLLLIDLAGRRRWVPVVTALVLAWVLVGDALVIFIGAAPLAVAGAARACRGVARREGWRAQWYELSMAAAAIVSVPAGLAAVALIKALGGWRMGSLQTQLAPVALLAGNLRITGQGLLELFGADFTAAGSARGVAFAAAHLAGVALVAWGACAAVRGFLRPGRLVEAALVAAIAFNVAAYAFGVQVTDLLSTREIAPVLPLGAALAGRLVAPRLLARRPRRLAPALAAGLAVYAAMLGYGAAQPAPRPASADLAAWLSAHHLRYGLSGYTQANIVTVETQGRVALRPVGPAGPDGRYISARQWEAMRSWYDQAAHRANFAVLSSVGAAEVSGPEVIATFGRPARTYHYREYTIMVWNENLLARLLPAG